ncbi:MAG: hypothetical protein H6602_09690 [Flavobacteriales bacterium]|nr:hypothetical protein [Flavobacteriales bacterium]MCB9191922.1 hypothetical protein [Flavobacteriales bacterium]
MIFRKSFSSLSALVFALSLFHFQGVTAQTDSDVAQKDTAEKKIDFIFSLGGGVARFMGDVQDASKKANVHLLGNRAVFGFHFGAAVSKSFTVSTNMFYGKLSGNENTFRQNRNFESNMVLAGVVAEYNFAGLYKDRLPILNPFINAGAYYGSYWNVNTDLVNGNGDTYYYWTDGTIRNQAQTGLEIIDRDAQNISRDYEYETQLVNGTLHTFNVSAGFGLDFHISRAVTFRLMSRYFFALNDKVDGNYTGDAKGLNDGFFYNSLSLVFNAMAFSKNRKDEKPNYKYLFDVSNLNEVETEDRDGDGVVDLKDRCAATPKGIEVDKEGCPLDKDVDGIPDYRDKNPSSLKDEIVDQNGASVNYELVAQKWTDSPNVYGISWDKRYDNPRFKEDLGYTVNVDVTDKDNRSPKIQKVLRIPELRKEYLNDSLVVYRLGVYEKYEEVEEKRQQLVDDGIYTAYSVPENSSMESVQKFTELPLVEDEKLVNSYGIKESIDLIKTSTAYTYPQLDYTLSRFERYLYEQVQEAALVEDYLQAISAFTWDKVVKRSSDTVYARLEQYPVGDWVKRVNTGLAEQNETIEAPDELTVGETQAPEVHAASVETRPEKKAVEEVVERPVEEVVVEPIPEPMVEEEVVEKTEPIVENVKTETAVVESKTQTVTEPAAPVAQKTEKKADQPKEEIVPEAITGEKLEKAIEQIRSTSNLNKQPRINYAPVKPQFKEADVNNDQLISALEIQMVLEDILKGQSTFSSERFNEMNEYFTDFTQNVEPIDFGGTKVAFVNGVLTILKTEGGQYEESSRRLLARKYKEADFDKDGELMPEEVQKMIDLFMKGGSPYSQEKVHELIDLYFD